MKRLLLILVLMSAIALPASAGTYPIWNTTNTYVWVATPTNDLHPVSLGYFNDFTNAIADGSNAWVWVQANSNDVAQAISDASWATNWIASTGIQTVADAASWTNWMALYWDAANTNIININDLIGTGSGIVTGFSDLLLGGVSVTNFLASTSVVTQAQIDYWNLSGTNAASWTNFYAGDWVTFTSGVAYLAALTNTFTGVLYADKAFRTSTDATYAPTEYTTVDKVVELLGQTGEFLYGATNDHPVITGDGALYSSAPAIQNAVTNVLAAGTSLLGTWFNTNAIDTFISRGSYDMHFYARAFGNGGPVISTYVELVESDGGATTNVLATSPTKIITKDGVQFYFAPCNLGTNIFISGTDHYLGVRSYGIRTGGSSGSFVLYVGGDDYASHMDTPQLTPSDAYQPLSTILTTIDSDITDISTNGTGTATNKLVTESLAYLWYVASTNDAFTAAASAFVEDATTGAAGSIDATNGKLLEGAAVASGTRVDWFNESLHVNGGYKTVDWADYTLGTLTGTTLYWDDTPQLNNASAAWELLGISPSAGRDIMDWTTTTNQIATLAVTTELDPVWTGVSNGVAYLAAKQTFTGTTNTFSGTVNVTGDLLTNGVALATGGGSSVSLTGYTLGIDTTGWNGWQVGEGSLGSGTNNVVFTGYSTPNATNNGNSGWAAYSSDTVLNSKYAYGWVPMPAVATKIGGDGIKILVRSSSDSAATNKVNILCDDTINTAGTNNLVSSTSGEWLAFTIAAADLPVAWTNTGPTNVTGGIVQRGFNVRCDFLSSHSNSISAKIFVDWD